MFKEAKPPPWPILEMDIVVVNEIVKDLIITGSYAY